MSELHATFTLLLAEVNLLLLVAGGIVAAVLLGRRQRDGAALARLVARLKTGLPERLKAHREFLAARGLDEAEADRTAQDLARTEDQFFRTVTETYVRRDSAAAGQLDRFFAAAVAPYRSLSGGGAADAAADARSEELVRAQRRIEELEAQNQLLQETGEAQGQPYEEVTGMPAEPGDEPVAEDAAEDPVQDEEPAADPEADADSDSEADSGLEDLNLDDIDLGLDDDVRHAG